MYIKYRILLLISILIFSLPLFAQKVINLTLGGTQQSYEYTAELLSRVLRSEGYSTDIQYVGDIPTTRLEYMMENGEISCFILGETELRSQRFLSIPAKMTNNLMGHRILFIRPEDQSFFESVYSLEDLQNLGKICGMGSAWGDVSIWKENGLPVLTLDGDWRRLYNMVASGDRRVDYLSRGAQEIIEEYSLYPELTVEKNLVLVYPKDHILYVSPHFPELYEVLSTAIFKAEKSGLIARIAREFFTEIYEYPVDLDKRRIINLELPD